MLDVVQGYTLPKVPAFRGIFNHMITYLPEFDIYQDTTDSTAAFGHLPELEAGRTGLLLTQNGGKVVKLPGEPDWSRYEDQSSPKN